MSNNAQTLTAILHCLAAKMLQIYPGFIKSTAGAGSEPPSAVTCSSLFQGSFLGGRLSPEWTKESENYQRDYCSALRLEGQHSLSDLSQSRKQCWVRTRQSHVQHHHQETTWVHPPTPITLNIPAPFEWTWIPCYSYEMISSLQCEVVLVRTSLFREFQSLHGLLWLTQQKVSVGYTINNCPVYWPEQDAKTLNPDWLPGYCTQPCRWHAHFVCIILVFSAPNRPPSNIEWKITNSKIFLNWEHVKAMENESEVTGYKVSLSER